MSTSSAEDEPFTWCPPLHSKDELNVASAMAGLATQVYAVFAVAVALGGPRTPPRPRELIFTDRARREGLARWVCSAWTSVLQRLLGRGRAKANEHSRK